MQATAELKSEIETVDKLERAGYRIIGAKRQGAVKICSYTKRALTGKGGCYKQKFYGISSHRCVQMTPDVFSCNHNCLFCWRDTRAMKPKPASADAPERIVSDSILAQRELLVGFKGDSRVSASLFAQASEPNQVAISLAGEPTLYPKLSSLLSEYSKRGFTTFVVSNGTKPKVLAKLNPLPTQLYLTLPAPDEKTYVKTCVPAKKGLWKEILSSLKILGKLPCRKVLRLTLARNLNFIDPAGYGRLILLAKPEYVEVKSYVNVGYSTRRLSRENMLSHDEIVEFAGKIAKSTGYLVTDEFPDSRVVLLSRDRKAEKARIIKRRGKSK
jgi:tRNA wybutosine-synthesizing protein 1